MPRHECKTCGGELIVKIGADAAVCDHCGKSVALDPQDVRRYRDTYQSAQRLMRTGTLAGYTAALTRLESISFIPEARAQADECRATLELAEADLSRNENLIGKNAVSQSGYDASLSTRNVAKARLAKALANLELLEEGTRQEDLAAARASVAQAEAALARAKIAFQDADLQAPNDGVVLTRVAEPGTIVAAGQTVATLSVRDVVWVYIFVEEPDLGKVAPGVEVEISTDSSEKKYVGHVGYVSPEAEFTPKTVETPNLRTNLVYRARIVVETPDLGLRQGAPVSVKIPLGAAGTGELGLEGKEEQ